MKHRYTFSYKHRRQQKVIQEEPTLETICPLDLDNEEDRIQDGFLNLMPWRKEIKTAPTHQDRE